MEIFNTTGLAKTSVKEVVNKGIGSLVFRSNLAVDELVNEKINIQVERNGSSNLEITNGLVPLKDFLLCATYGDDAITSNATYKTVCVIELAQEGAIPLGEKDLIKIEMSGLNSVKNYLMNGIEEPVQSHHVYTYERKALASEHPQGDIDTKGFDVCVMTNSNTISEINKTWENGVVTKYSTDELGALSQDNDPIAYVKQDGTVLPSFPDLLQLPLSLVDKLTVRKEPGALVSFMLRHQVPYIN